MQKKLRLRSRDLQYLLTISLIATVATFSVAFQVLNPYPTQAFFAMWILGATGKADNYYPGGDTNIAVGENVNWTLGVYNHMGSIEYVVVRVKLLNFTQGTPNELSGTPSPIQSVMEFRTVLLDNETWSIPFLWIIQNITVQNDVSSIRKLDINQILLQGVLATAVSGLNFRFIFELWFYDIESHSLAFSWQAVGVRHSVWTQIWFNATQT